MLPSLATCSYSSAVFFLGVQLSYCLKLGGVAVLLAVFQLGLTLQQLCTAESIAALSSASYLEVL